MSSWQQRIRARDPYYRITGRDPAKEPSVAVTIVILVVIVVGVRLIGSIWVAAVVVGAVLVLAELAARIVERRRDTRAR